MKKLYVLTSTTILSVASTFFMWLNSAISGEMFSTIALAAATSLVAWLLFSKGSNILQAFVERAKKAHLTVTESGANLLSGVKKMFKYSWAKNNRQLQLCSLLGYAFLIAEHLLAIIFPVFSKWTIDALTEHDGNYLYILIAGSLVEALCNIISTVRNAFVYYFERAMERYLEQEAFLHLHNLSLRWHVSKKLGEVTSTTVQGAKASGDLFYYLILNLLPAALDLVLGFISFSFLFDVRLATCMLAMSLVYISLMVYLSDRKEKALEQWQDADEEAEGVMLDSLMNFETVKHFNAEQLEFARYKKAKELCDVTQRQNEKSSMAFEAAEGLFRSGTNLMASLLFAQLVIGQKSFTPGDYVLFSIYLRQLNVPADVFKYIVRYVKITLVAADKLAELMSQQPEIVDSLDAEELDLTDASIEFRNVSFRYLEDVPVLHNVSFCVPAGQTTAIVGQSGSGKSTLTKLLFRFYDVADGEICIGGQNIKNVTLRSLRQAMGIVAQEPVLFNDTIRYNILYGLPSASEEDVEEAARTASIHEYISTQPEGYNTVVGERGLKLSGGEKQRIAIARVALKRPEFVILDEATSALDSTTERAIQASLAELCRGKTSIVIAHRLSTIKDADQIIVLEKGRIVESGSHEELLKKDGAYALMWTTQNG